MLTAGIDLAAQPAKTGAVLVDWSSNYTAAIDLSQVSLVAVKQVDKGTTDLTLGTPPGWSVPPGQGQRPARTPR